jgi:hypothetical protein
LLYSPGGLEQYPHYKFGRAAILQLVFLFVKRKKSWLAFFDVELNKLGPFDNQNFFYDKAKDVFVVEVVFLLKDVYEWFYDIVCIGCDVAYSDYQRKLQRFFGLIKVAGC